MYGVVRFPSTDSVTNTPPTRTLGERNCSENKIGESLNRSRYQHIADLLADAGCFDGARKFRQIAREQSCARDQSQLVVTTGSDSESVGAGPSFEVA